MVLPRLPRTRKRTVVPTVIPPCTGTFAFIFLGLPALVGQGDSHLRRQEASISFVNCHHHPGDPLPRPVPGRYRARKILDRYRARKIPGRLPPGAAAGPPDAGIS